MKETKSVFKTNVIYGVLVLVPLAVIVLLLAKIVEILEKIAEPLQLQSATGVFGAIILALLLVLSICFIVGAMVRTRLGAWSFERFERKILFQIPGFEIIRMNERKIFGLPSSCPVRRSVTWSTSLASSAVNASSTRRTASSNRAWMRWNSYS